MKPPSAEFALATGAPWRYRRWLAGMVAMGLVAACGDVLTVALIFPLLEAAGAQGAVARGPLGPLLDGLLGDASPAALLQFTGGSLAVVWLVRGVALYRAQAYAFRISTAAEAQTRSRVYSHALDVSVFRIAELPAGQLGTYVMHHCSLLAAAYPFMVLALLNGIQLLLLVGFVVAVSPLMALFAIAVILPCVMLVRRLLAAPLLAAGRQSAERARSVSNRFESTLGAIQVIHLLSAQDRVRAQYERSVDDYRLARGRALRLQHAVEPMISASAVVILGAVLVAVPLVLDVGAAEVSSAVVALGALTRMVSPISSLASAVSAYVNSAGLAGELAEFLPEEDADAPASMDGRAAAPPLERGVALEQVVARYAESGPAALRGVSLDIAARGVTAIVGRSGAGKTTLVHLVTGLLEPSEGRVCVDGTGLEQLDLNEWRKQIAIVPQDPQILNDTVETNLRLASPEASEEAMLRALERAQAREFVVGLEQGLRSNLGDRGTLLSGGQRQRIAIARALIREPRLLILDEATSQLDSATEMAIIRELWEIAELTTLVITHRAHTLAGVERIFVLEDGAVAESGSFSSLASSPGAFSALLAAGDARQSAAQSPG